MFVNYNLCVVSNKARICCDLEKKSPKAFLLFLFLFTIENKSIFLMVTAMNDSVMLITHFHLKIYILGKLSLKQTNCFVRNNKNIRKL